MNDKINYFYLLFFFKKLKYFSKKLKYFSKNYLETDLNSYKVLPLVSLLVLPLE
jgi:hypothetical protein